ncbi:hypothetical protein [Arthrobacter sp. KNU40]|uniref:hypothetical protein n=1 Tax=Arthrobacter sp. KNU40 TaxID=3447965 RepID=UPI003F63CC89
MPRVTQRDQYERHLFLRMLWVNNGAVFAQLRAADQWRVHSFYQPDEELSPREFKAHLRRVKLGRPGLVHVAGKLFLRLHDQFVEMERRRRLAAIAKPALPVRPRRQNKYRRIVVYGVVRPRPDLQKLVAAAKALVREQVRQKEASPDQQDIDTLS